MLLLLLKTLVQCCPGNITVHNSLQPAHWGLEPAHLLLMLNADAK